MNGVEPALLPAAAGCTEVGGVPKVVICPKAAPKAFSDCFGCRPSGDCRARDGGLKPDCSKCAEPSVPKTFGACGGNNFAVPVSDGVDAGAAAPATAHLKA